jgi:hypothetical protein
MVSIQAEAVLCGSGVKDKDKDKNRIKMIFIQKE